MPAKHGRKEATVWIVANSEDHQDQNRGASNGVAVVIKPDDQGKVDVDFDTTVEDIIPSGDLTDCRDIVTEQIEIQIVERVTQSDFASWAPVGSTKSVNGIRIHTQVDGFDYARFVIEQTNKHRTVLNRYNTCTKATTKEYGGWCIDETIVITKAVRSGYGQIQSKKEYTDLMNRASEGEKIITKTIDGNTEVYHPLNLPKIEQDWVDTHPELKQDIADIVAQLSNISNVAAAISSELHDKVMQQSKEIVEMVQDLVYDSVISGFNKSMDKVQQTIKEMVKSNFGLDDALRRQESQFKPSIKPSNTPVLNSSGNLAIWLTQTGSNGYYDAWTNNRFPVEFYPDMSGITTAKPSYSGIHIGSTLTLGQATMLGFTGLPTNVNTFVVTGIDWVQQWGQNSYGGAWKTNLTLGW